MKVCLPPKYADIRYVITSPEKSQAEALTPTVTVFAEGASKGVIRVE